MAKRARIAADAREIVRLNELFWHARPCVLRDAGNVHLASFKFSLIWKLPK